MGWPAAPSLHPKLCSKWGGGLMSVLLCYPDRGRGQGVAHVGPDLPLRDVAGYLGAVRSHPCPAAWLSPERLHVSKHAAMFGSLFLNFWGKTIWCFCPHLWRNCCQKHWCHSRPHRASWTSSAADNVQIFKMFFMRNCYFLSQLKTSYYVIKSLLKQDQIYTKR